MGKQNKDPRRNYVSRIQLPETKVVSPTENLNRINALSRYRNISAIEDARKPKLSATPDYKVKAADEAYQRQLKKSSQDDLLSGRAYDRRKNSFFTPIESYNEQRERVKTLTPLDRAKYNYDKTLKSADDFVTNFDKRTNAERIKSLLNVAKGSVKTVANVHDVYIEPAAQLIADASGYFTRSGQQILNNLSSNDKIYTREDFSKEEQDVIDKTAAKIKGNYIARTDYGSEYGFKKNEGIGSQIKRKLFDPVDVVTNVLGSAYKTDDKIVDVYNFDKEGNRGSESADDKNNKSISERLFKMGRDYLFRDVKLDQAIANNLRTVGGGVDYRLKKPSVKPSK